MRGLSAVRGRRGQDPYAELRARLKAQVPYVAAMRTRPPDVPPPVRQPSVFEVATYNVHRWTGLAGGRRWNPDLACDVIAELQADVLALQEVLVPFDAENPLERLSEELGLHYSFVTTRIHRRGELGNAILSRWPMSAVFTIDLSFSRFEKRSAVATQFDGGAAPFAVVATHLALVDRTRRRQVQLLLGHPDLQGAVLLLGDMNAWRQCHATRQLDREFTSRHHNRAWPPSFPAARPVLALDRIYGRGARVVEVRTHESVQARRGSDHLPVVATVALGEDGQG